jgi:methylenetetrahydrofolate dehydrogenase (NADP+) / methenyltetrahydrofolate cyclohydrolase
MRVLLPHSWYNTPVMKELNGSELAGFIKERQAKTVRGLRQQLHVTPKLAIVQTKDDPVINTYVRLKKNYGADILVDVVVHFVKQSDIKNTIQSLNDDESVHGIIVQLPLNDTNETDEILNLVSSEKDVDALGHLPSFDPATPMAIMWLLAGYNVKLEGRKIVLVGQGKLVGAPLHKQLSEAGYDVRVADRNTENLENVILEADVIITATGSPAIIYPDMLKSGAVVVDAGVASEDGKTVGDLHPTVYDREDLVLTPAKGGVGPLTVCALFENVISAARRKTTDDNRS